MRDRKINLRNFGDLLGREHKRKWGWWSSSAMETIPSAAEGWRESSTTAERTMITKAVDEAGGTSINTSSRSGFIVLSSQMAWLPSQIFYLWKLEKFKFRVMSTRLSECVPAWTIPFEFDLNENSSECWNESFDVLDCWSSKLRNCRSKKIFYLW